MPASFDLPVPSRALAIGAHPDDVEFGAGATLAKWAAAGCAVTVAICTDGSKGTWDPSADLADLVATRQREAADAVAVLGGVDVVFLGAVDGELDNDRATRSALARVIRAVRPEVVLGHDPWRRYRLHPDHRAAGFATTDALVAARDPHFFPEHGLAPHRPGALLLFEADEPDHAEEVGEGHVASKVAALECHRSQFESTMFIAEDDQGAQRERFRAEQHAAAVEAGAWAGVALAERFRLMATDR